MRHITHLEHVLERVCGLGARQGGEQRQRGVAARAVRCLARRRHHRAQVSCPVIRDGVNFLYAGVDQQLQGAQHQLQRVTKRREPANTDSRGLAPGNHARSLSTADRINPAICEGVQ